ncbi:MAG: transporter substrate-binding protein [Candidatus Aminicenantes bacterium]|nr:transporter substrate-binding protein [Candidatus Aminicenantes bacterium]
MVRSSALRALGQMGATARNAIPQIMPLLQDSNVIVQEQALRYLIQTSDPSIAFFPTILTLLGDSDPIVRRLAVNALCKLTPKSPESLPNLARSLDFVYSSAVVRITDLVVEIVSVAEDKLDSSCIGPLSDIVRKHGKNISTAQLNIIKNSILHIQYRSSNTFFEWLIRGLFGSPWVLVPTVYLFFIVFVWQVALRVCPLLILRINFALQPYDARLPEHLGGFQLPLRWLLVVGMFQYHIRVLDAWVKTHLHEARTNFENKDTVAQRKVYVASPVELGGTAYPYVTPDILRPEISSPRWCILIYGEGGIGKTALACEIARWGMSEIPTSKLCAAHPMLPVLLEPGVVPEKLDHTDAFLNSISGHLRALIGATEELNIEFVRHLLIHGRVIVIADDVVVNPASPDFPAAALLVTSREKCVLGDVPKTCILPQQIHAEYLSNFLNAYLTVKGERPSFTDTNFFGACQRLSAIVRDRSITALLAKMYAELLIASKSYGTPLAFKDIPELMLGYLAELNRRKDETWLSDEEVCTYLQKIARASLNQDYRLTSFDRARLITESETYDMISIFDYLEKRLHVIRSLGFSRSRYSFTIEPLGEYLAAMDIVRDVSNDSSRWDQIIHRISNQSDNSFAHALWDCVLSKGRSTDCPGWVAARLSELIPKDVVVVSPECIKIGVIHSLSGTMSISERSLVDAVQLAVDEINLQGGLLGRRLVTMVEDGASEPATFARKAERLILEEKVCALFGCWTSASRKAVLSVVEENDHLLFYPLQYEGFESSKNIIYTGASPNQQIIPAVQWCMKELKRTRPFLIGSDYVFPRTANKIIRALLPEFGGVCAGEVYRRLGDRCFEDVVQQLHDSGADVIFNTINGDSNIGFFQAMKAAAVRPDTIPVISFSFAEEELRAIGTELMAGHYCAWNYFQSVDSEENRMFVAAFKGKYGQERVTDDPIEAAYFGVHVFALAVMKAQSADPRAIREACRGLTFLAPRGQITIDPINQHTWAIARVGRIRKDGQFEIVWNSPEIIPPNPYPIEIDKL